MKNLVRDLITDLELDEIENGLKRSIATATAKAVTLDMPTRMKRRKMGTARQGYVELVQPIATNNSSKFGADLDPQKLAAYMNTRRRVATVRGLAQKLLELCDDTNMAIGIDAVAMADDMSGVLQIARKRDDGLDTEMGELDAYNSRFGKQMEEEDEIEEEEDDDDATPPASPAA